MGDTFDIYVRDRPDLSVMGVPLPENGLLPDTIIVRGTRLIHVNIGRWIVARTSMTIPDFAMPEQPYDFYRGGYRP